MKEEWREIPEYENYIVSNKGIVKNKATNKRIQPVKNNAGYFQVIVQPGHKHFLVHRLVAICFLKNRKNYPFVCFKNYDKEKFNTKNVFWRKNLHERKRSKNKKQVE